MSSPPNINFENGLYIVATPIGNLADMSQRVISVLKAADIVAVEDSRVTGKLLYHLGIKKKMRPYHDHSNDKTRDELLEIAANGIVALVSDAGTPLISDPGYKLVRAAREQGIYVSTMPGPSAAIAALTLSGLPTDRFCFEGFLPNKTKARKEALEKFISFDATLLFYESGARLGKSLSNMLDILGDREAAIVREITKKFEETVQGGLAELTQRYSDESPKGEIVVVVAPPIEGNTLEKGDMEEALREALTRLPASKAAGEIAARFGEERKEVYALANIIKLEE